MGSVFENLLVIGQASVGRFAESDAVAWDDVACPICGAARMLRVAAAFASGREGPITAWLRCPACQAGAVKNYSNVHPRRRPLGEVQGLGEGDEALWQEIRACLGANAYTAAVMLCRKLLFHVAVSKGMDPKTDKGRAPSFAASIDYLETLGYVTPPIRAWVDEIKEVGNEANHEIVPISEEEAMNVARLTEQLLVLLFQMDSLRRR